MPFTVKRRASAHLVLLLSLALIFSMEIIHKEDEPLQIIGDGCAIIFTSEA